MVNKELDTFSNYLSLSHNAPSVSLCELLDFSLALNNVPLNYKRITMVLNSTYKNLMVLVLLKKQRGLANMDNSQKELKIFFIVINQ